MQDAQNSDTTGTTDSMIPQHVEQGSGPGAYFARENGAAHQDEPFTGSKVDTDPETGDKAAQSDSDGTSDQGGARDFKRDAEGFLKAMRDNPPHGEPGHSCLPGFAGPFTDDDDALPEGLKKLLGGITDAMDKLLNPEDEPPVDKTAPAARVDMDLYFEDGTIWEAYVGIVGRAASDELAEEVGEHFAVRLSASQNEDKWVGIRVDGGTDKNGRPISFGTGHAHFRADNVQGMIVSDCYDMDDDDREKYGLDPWVDATDEDDSDDEIDPFDDETND